MSLGAHEPHLYSLGLLVTGAMGAPVFLHSGRKKQINSYRAMRARGGRRSRTKQTGVNASPDMADAPRNVHMQNRWISQLIWPDNAVYCCCTPPYLHLL